MRLDDRELPSGSDDSAHEGQSARTRPRGDRAPVDEPLRTDREVPLRRRTSQAVHDWLDGDLDDAPADAESAGHVAFWQSMEGELAEYRRARTPAHLEQAIMNAIYAAPRDSAEVGATEPEHEAAEQRADATTNVSARPVEMSPLAMTAAAAGLIGIGALLGALLS